MRSISRLYVHSKIVGGSYPKTYRYWACVSSIEDLLRSDVFKWTNHLGEWTVLILKRSVRPHSSPLPLYLLVVLALSTLLLNCEVNKLGGASDWRFMHSTMYNRLSWIAWSSFALHVAVDQLRLRNTKSLTHLSKHSISTWCTHGCFSSLIECQY